MAGQAWAVSLLYRKLAVLEKNLKRNPEIPDFAAGYLDKSINLMRSGGCR